MSRLTAPGFSRLKAPGYSGIRPRSAIVSSANGTAAPQDTSGSTSQQQQQHIPSAPQARSALKKPSNSKLTENQQDQTKVVKPVIPGLSQPKGSKSTTKLAANQASQHGTGPYDLPATQASGNIPYVGKKRSSGVLKAPDSRTNMTKPQLQNGTDKRNDTIVVDPKAAKKKIIPPKSSENGVFAVPAKPSSKQRVSLPLNKGCSDLSKMDPSRRQTISTPDSARSNSKLTKNPVGIRPRSCVMPTEMKKNDQKKVISKSLQNIPKAIPMPSMNRGLNKRDVRKSGSHDDILNCTKKETAIKRPVAGVIPRTKSGGFTSKFGFSTPAQPRASSTTAMHSTPDINQNNQTQRTLGDEKLSPIGGKSDFGVKSDFDVKSTTETVNTDEHSDTKTINIIINLEEYNTNANLSTKDGVSMGAPVNGSMFNSSSTPNKTFDLNKAADNSHLNTTIDLNKTRDLDINDTQILGKTNNFNPSVAVVNGNETFEISPPPLDETKNLDLNATRILDSNSTYSAHILHENNNNCLNKTINIGTTGAILNKTQKMNETIVLDSHAVNVNTTQIIPSDSMDKSDSGFDDTNFNISDILPPSFNSMTDVSCGDLSEDVLKVIAAISSNINRPSNITTFSQSPIKNHVSSILQNDENICSVTNEENAWLNEDGGQVGVEDLVSQTTSHDDESNTLYQTDDLLSKSTSIDMSTVTSNNTQWQDKSNLIKFSSNYNEIVEPVIENRTYIEDEVFKDNLDTEDISLATDISQSTDQLRNCLSSIGTDTEDIEDIDVLPDVNPNLPLSSHDNMIEDSIFVGVKSHEIEDESSITEHLSDIGLRSHNVSSSMNSTHTLINNHTIMNTKHLLNTSVDRVNDIEIPTSIEYSDINASITDKTSGICFTNDTTIDQCSESISKEIADAIIRDSGHSTDVNENEINSALSADLNKLNIEHVKADLFTELTEQHISDVCPSTPPTEFEKSMSSDATYPSTPLSRQESLEYDLARRCNTIDCTRKMRKVGRSRTYSSSELITKFRIPKELKCIETSEGDILMDKTTFLHFMNEVKLVKTSLLKLKRTLVEAQCTSPLVKSPLKRANSAVEASAIPPLSPRTCQCSPMAVVNPLVLTSSGNVSTSTKEKESLSLEDQIALLNEKLEDSANTVKALQTQLVDSTSSVKLLQTQLENHEQKEQDIIEENILLREEISHLTERLRNARVTEGGGEDGTTASFEDIDLAVDLDSRLSILQRLYSDG